MESVDPEFLKMCGSNIVTVVGCLTIYILYKRCIGCSSHIHSSWLTCDSDSLRAKKKEAKKSLFKEALNEIKIETMRLKENGTEL